VDRSHNNEDITICLAYNQPQLQEK
jgi:hypothetical protein